MLPTHQPGRVPGLDLLRAIAIAWVMAYHVTSYGVALSAVAEYGWMGVDLFFVLSGYLIGGQVFAQCASAEGPRWKDFMLRRALRVLPAYLAVLALYLWVPAWRESPGMQPAWQYLTFTANIFPDYFNNRAFSHAWSLCVEEHFYLLLPLAVTLLAWRPAAWKAVALVLAILAGGALVRALAWQLEVAPYLQVSGGRDDWMLRYVEHIYNPTWARFDGLLAGAVLAALRQFRPRWWAWMTARSAMFLATGLAITASTTLLLFVGPPRLATALAGYPLVALGLGCIVLAFASPQSLPGRLRIPGARVMATLAFSLYLTHKSAYHLVRTHGGLPDGGPAALAAYAGAALLAGALLYLAVERPGLLLRARLAVSRRPGDSSSPPPPRYRRSRPVRR